MKKVFCFLCCTFSLMELFCSQYPKARVFPPKGIEIFKNSYKNFIFEDKFNPELGDWEIKVTESPSINNKNPRSQSFLWRNSAMIPVELAKNEDLQYDWPLIYSYPKITPDPEKFSEEQRQQLMEFGKVRNRRESNGNPLYFFDFIYDAGSRKQLESHIKKSVFLGKTTNCHELIIEPLQRVEKRILALAKQDKEVNKFLTGLKSADAYAWRVIDGTKRKSYHSYGIAVDVLPKRITGEIFWSWARDHNPEGWMVIPLKKRWLPPDAVIRIFEEEGFIWGGKWAIWDNMHFEYHPELIEYNNISEKFWK